MTKTLALRGAWLALCLASAAGPSLARPSVAMIELGRQQIVTFDGQPLTPDSMRKAILYGGLTRRWTAVGEQPGVLLGGQRLRRHDGTLPVRLPTAGRSTGRAPGPR